jgi:hypothetical protein
MLIKFEVNMQLPVICFLCLLSERFKEVTDAVCGECRLAKDDDIANAPVNTPAKMSDVLKSAFIVYCRKHDIMSPSIHYCKGTTFQRANFARGHLRDAEGT